MDRCRIVTFNANGRPYTQLDLNDGSLLAFQRDQFKITPPVSTPITANSARRFDGERMVAESHTSGNVSGTCYIQGSSADNTMLNVEKAFKQLYQSNRKLYLEWRPDGASRSIYYEIRGTGAPAMEYRWIEFSTNHVTALQFAIPVAPLAIGDPMDVTDDFYRPERTLPPATDDGLSDYTRVMGTAGHLAVNNTIQNNSPQQLQPQVALPSESLIHTSKGYTYDEITLEMNVFVGSTVSAGNNTFYLYLKWQDANNFVRAQWDGTNLSIVSNVAGTPTTIASAAQAMTANTYYIFRAGWNNDTGAYADVYTASLFLQTVAGRIAPKHNARAGSSGWSGTGITVAPGSRPGAWAGISTAIGFGVASASPANMSDWLIYRFSAWPFYWAGSKQTIAQWNPANPVVGSAPALLDVDVAMNSISGNAIRWALLSAFTRPPSPLSGYVALPGIVDSAAMTVPNRGVGGFAAEAADTAAYGGSAAPLTLTGGSASIGFVLDPSTLIPDEFSDDIYLDVWARLSVPTTATSLSVSISAGGNYALGQGSVELGSSITKKFLQYPSSGTQGYRMYRLGTIVLRADPTNPMNLSANNNQFTFIAQFASGASSTGTLNLDFMAFTPVRQRAYLPTGKQIDGLSAPYLTYPVFTLNSQQQVKRIKSDLTGWIGGPQDLGMAQDNGLTGAPLVIDPGLMTFLWAFSDEVPDDPNTNVYEQMVPAGAAGNLLGAAFHVTPRYFIGRGP